VPPISQLLDVQALDLASDELRARRRALPEREALRTCREHGASLDAAHAALLEKREALTRAEHALGAEVTDVAGRASASEATLYSGTVRAPKELQALQHEIRLVRATQSGLEEKEMQLLEEIEETERELADNRAARTESDAEAAAVEAALRRAETEIDAELAALAERRQAESDGVPPAILAEYERLRTRERLGGRAAAPLADGSCGGCRVKLPVLEYNRMRAQPDDAPITCSRCGRILVR
jgi:predicted  nucleic acid-binding Zn-ribbon protein